MLKTNHTSLVFVSLLVLTILAGLIKVLYNRRKYVLEAIDAWMILTFELD